VPVERPIIFSGPMVKALLAGTKSQTRRVIKPQPKVEPRHEPLVGEAWASGFVDVRCPYGEPGDRLWVRETWGLASSSGYLVDPTLNYRADGAQRCVAPEVIHAGYVHRDGWRSPIHMPRWASRITLEVAGVRVERLHAITDVDAVAEGIERAAFGGWAGELTGDGITRVPMATPRCAFIGRWREIHSAKSWSENPFVWVIEFTRVARWGT
jgi:hypothetical protein